MAFETGTATDAENLFALFRTFITSDAALAAESPSQVWTEEAYSSVVDGNGNNLIELSLRGPGLGAADNIFVNLRLHLDTVAGSDAWSVDVFGATAFDSGSSFENMPGNSAIGSRKSIVPLFDQSMPFWFFANGRRFIIIAQVTTSVYVNCYCGFILPFSPSVAALEYTYPLYIGASLTRSGLRFSSTSNTNHRSFWQPGFDSTSAGGGILYTPGNFWLNFQNLDAGGSIYSQLSSTGNGQTVPYANGSYSSQVQTRMENQELLLGGDYLLTDVTLVRGVQETGLEAYGVLDGVVHVSGVSQSAQNTLIEGGDTYTVYQEAFRTGQADYVAIKQ